LFGKVLSKRKLSPDKQEALKKITEERNVTVPGPGAYDPKPIDGDKIRNPRVHIPFSV